MKWVGVVKYHEKEISVRRQKWEFRTNFYPGVDKFEIHFEGRINTPEEQLNKENKEKGQLKNRNQF